jgi:hypothetical protein
MLARAWSTSGVMTMDAVWMLLGQGQDFRDGKGFVYLLAVTGQLFRERVRRCRCEQDQDHGTPVYLVPLVSGEVGL